MPQIINSIDAIARQKGRAVLCLNYRRSKADIVQEGEHEDYDTFGECNWQENPVRDEIITGLEALGIDWLPCSPLMNPGSFFDGYLGDIYLDVPFDKNNPAYQKLSAFLEDDEEGWCRFPGVAFCYLPLEMAMEYAFDDEPEVW